MKRFQNNFDYLQQEIVFVKTKRGLVFNPTRIDKPTETINNKYNRTRKQKDFIKQQFINHTVLIIQHNQLILYGQRIDDYD